MSNWGETFGAVYRNAERKFAAGEHLPQRLFTSEETGFLRQIGCTPQELFDFIEDASHGGDPAFETVLLVTSVRRDYFLFVQNGQPGTQQIDMDQLPAKTAELDGIPWLPRIIEKAKAKLRGEMPADLMYLCGGDRPFLRKMNVDPADFLHIVWKHWEDTAAIVKFVKQSAGRSPGV